MINITKKPGRASKKKIDKELREWWRENKFKKKLLKEAMSTIENIED
jgi:hypothetical protein